MSDRTPPGIKPGSDGRGWRAFLYVIIFGPFVILLAVVGVVVGFGAGR